MRTLALLSAATFLTITPAMAADGPEPPHAPTPDEAAAAYAAPGGATSVAAPAPGKGDAATAPTKDAAAKDTPSKDAPAKDAPEKATADGADAVRKAQAEGAYKMKDGGMYQPPQSRPAPLWNKGYGRT